MEFRVWNTARTPEQILGNFDRGLAGEPAPADLAYTFPGASGSQTPLRGKARVEGTLDAPPLLTAAEASDLERRLDHFRQLAQSDADPARGRTLFETTCMVCHQVGGRGSALAPPLDGASHRGIDGLLRALLTPNAAIESGYRRFRVETADEELLDGFLVSQDAAGVVLRLPNTGEWRIPTGQIKRAGFTRTSLMPEGLLESMDPHQASELLAYLLSLK
jgi:putative heme-binding domain-containing protein